MGALSHSYVGSTSVLPDIKVLEGKSLSMSGCGYDSSSRHRKDGLRLVGERAKRVRQS